MARVRLVWVWLIALMIAVMSGCGGDDSQTPEPGDAAKDSRTDTTPASDVRSDTPDVRTDLPTTDAPETGAPDIRPDMPGTMDAPVDLPRPPDADAPQPPRDVTDVTPPPDRIDAPLPPSDVTDISNPPSDVTDAPLPPQDVADVFRCTADNQCPSNAPHCNTTTGACVSPSSVAVTPNNPSIALGTQQQFQATITYSDTSTGPGTSTVTWSSGTTGVATINAGGLATSVTVGSSTITATLGALTGTSVLTVTNATLTSIALEPTNPTNALGTTRQFTATGTFSNNTTQDLTAQVTWTSGTTSVATINAAGLASTLAQGDTVITATSGAISGTTTLHVTSATLVSLAVTPPTPTIARLTTLPMHVTGTFTDNTTQDLTTQATWVSSDVSVATVSNTVGSQGLVTGTGAGQATITANVGAVNGSTLLTVTGASLQSISITPANPSVAKGLVVPFVATGTYSNSTTQDLTTLVTWTSSDTTRAVISNTPGSQGVASTVNDGTTTITAQYGSVSATTLLTVTPANLVSVAVTPTNPSIAKGTTQQFAATGTYTDNSTQNITTQVTWASTATGVGTVSNASGTQGLATGVTPGDTTISATLSGISGSTNLHVTNEVLVSIAIAPSNPSIAKGTDRAFVATGTYSDGSNQVLTTSVTWASSNTTTATISNAPGTEGRAHGAEVGNTNITATLGAFSASTQLTVTSAVLVSLNVTPAAPTIPNGTTQPFTATGTYTDGTNQNLTESASWSSSNGGVATVSNAAGQRGLATGNGLGTATITAAYQGVSGSTNLTVVAANLVSITVTPPSPTVAAGLTRQFQATGTYTDGTTLNITTSVLWNTVNASIATISNSGGSQGLATGVAAGETDVSATMGAIVGLAHITVVPAVLQSIQVTPTNPSAPLGTTVNFIATGTFSAGPPQDLTTQVTWSSSMTNIATISNAAGTEGEASALAAGATTIRATLNGVDGVTALNVIGAALQTITITPANLTVANGTQVQYKAIGNYTGGTTVDLTTQVTWGTSNGSLATVSSASGSEGLGTTLAVGGPIDVTAIFGAVTGTTQLTISAAVLQSITVTPATPSIARGTTQQFVATGHYSDATTQILTAQVNWGSSSVGVVSISNNPGTEGLATGVTANASPVTITASLNGVSGSTTMTVTSATLTSISVTPAGGGINPGDTRQYAAVGTYSDATTQDITQLVTWDSSAVGVATISNAAGSRGLATGVAVGTTTISASYGSGPPVVGSVTLTVN